jgi:hypothetical protein
MVNEEFNKGKQLIALDLVYEEQKKTEAEE